MIVQLIINIFGILQVLKMLIGLLFQVDLEVIQLVDLKEMIY